MPEQPHVPFHSIAAADALTRLGSSPAGLTADEAARRLRIHGPNALRLGRVKSAWSILVDQLRSVVVLLLLAAAAISVLARDVVDAIAIGAVLLLNTALGFVSELRARRAMESLLRLQAPRAVVIRDGRSREIEASVLVPGDVITLEAGQFIPADARVLETTDLRVNEAALTGESAPVDKTPAPVSQETALADRTSMLYQGTTVTSGTTLALIAATGMHTELGRIGELVSGVREERTPLEERLDALGTRLVWLAVGIAVLVTAIAVLRGLPVAEMVQTGIALAVAAVPESLPAVVTIALAVGVRRMARRKALIRRLPSAETLGSVTVICTDKTGTLTAGEMTATVFALTDREVAVSGTGYSMKGGFTEGDTPIDPRADPQLRRALIVGALANHADVTASGDGATVRGDPTEAALLVAAAKAGLERASLRREYPQDGEVPFSSERMFMATMHRPEGRLIACVKGAPARVLQMCARALSRDGEQPLDDQARERQLQRNRDLAARGLRVLALADGEVPRADEEALTNLTFLGFVGMMDPAAAGVRDTIRVFAEAGIRTVMITGDQQLTARAVAADLGILGAEDEVLDGSSIEGLSEEELADRLARVRGFSRVTPENKLAIIAAYQRRGDIVAMLGDGVNDAPALRKADVGVAMGTRGTDVAKEAAAVVLQDDRFSTIGVAVEQGRVIFDNVRKFVYYLFSCNLAEVLVLLVAAAAGLPLPLLPLQILWLNLLTDTLPALSLAVEPPEHDVMRRPPRDPESAIFSKSFLGAIAWAAALITGATLVAFWIGLDGGRAASPRALTMSFVTLALAQIFHLGNARSQRAVHTPRRIVSNPFALGAVAIVLLLQALAVHWSPLTAVLGTEPLALQDWLICLGLGLVPAVVGQGVRLRAP